VKQNELLLPSTTILCRKGVQNGVKKCHGNVRVYVCMRVHFYLNKPIEAKKEKKAVAVITQ
jgi:hypothetical protein